MKTKTIYLFIKTPCGRKKFEELSLKNDLFSKLRLYWFILFASIRDLNLPIQDISDESKF